MTTSRPAEESLPTDQTGLARCLAAFEEELKACEQNIQNLLKQEDPAKGLFLPKEIHRAKQQKMVARYNCDLCRVRLNKIREGM